MDDQRKDHIDPKGPTQMNRPKQLQTHNLPTDEVENMNNTNKRRDLLLMDCSLMNRKDAGKDPEAQQSYLHPKREEDQTENSTNGQWYDSASLDTDSKNTKYHMKS